MKVTAENWKDVEQKIREVGIQESVYDSDGVLETTVLKNGERYEFTMELFRQLQSKGLITVKIGRRVEPDKN